MEELHAEGLFSVEQIVWIFARCSRLQSMDWGGKRASGPGEPPLSARLVQLFSNDICERIPSLTPAQITTFVVALTSKALPMDEFWLFMMAKRVQDTAAEYNPGQIVTIASRYADKFLEDDEFFEALAEQVVQRRDEFQLAELASFLYCCSRLRFLHAGLCDVAMPLFEEPSRVRWLDGEALASLITAAATLDQQSFRPRACCARLAGVPWELRRAMESHDLAMGLVLSVVSLRHSAGVQVLLPQVLTQVAEGLTRFRGASDGRSRRQRSLRMARMLQRRVALVGLCAAFGAPRRQAWSLALMRQLHELVVDLDNLLSMEGAEQSNTLYEPASSSFHLEVVAVLQLMGIDHKLEVPQSPFCLDITVSLQQIESAWNWQGGRAVVT